MAELNENEEWIGLFGRSSGLKNALQEIADQAAQEARNQARKEAYKTGAFMRGIQGDVVGDSSGNLKGQVQETDWKSHFIEFGTSQQAARPILRSIATEFGNFSPSSTSPHEQALSNKRAASRAYSKAHPKSR